MKYFIKMSFNVAGCEGADTFEADNEHEAYDIGWEMAVEHASAYVEVVNTDDFTEEEWTEFEAEHESSYLGGFTTFGDIDFYVEEYDAEKHDDKLIRTYPTK